MSARPFTIATLLERGKTLSTRIPWASLGKRLRVGIISLFIIIFFRGSVPPPGDLYTVAASYARDSLFDYVGWEVKALGSKLFEGLFGVAGYMTEPDRADYVRAYMDDLVALQRIEADITAIYSDPTIEDPDTASAALRAERDSRREELANRQQMAENILETQVAAVLADEGLALLGAVMPPVAIHITPLPDVLIISPRDEIRVAASLSLDGMTTDRRAALESNVDADLEVSSLVVDIGGMALYPSMVAEYASLPWLVETTAHEWVHHYLFFFPLGLNYFDNGNPETRIINETTADLLGKEISRRVLARYYPELAPPEPPPAPPAEATPQPTPTPDPAAFDFSREMNETRVTVDDLLANGEIDAAEAYMAERRAFFHANGYPIRKINQAYFAFFGGYQGEDNFGTAGDDPIGPAIAQLRQQTGSIAGFLTAVRGITTREALLAAVE